MTAETKNVYIVLSQTGTVPSKLIRLFTGAEFNHASISMTKDLNNMYSFGRRNPYNPFWAGFVKENPASGTFKRFPNTKAVVLEVEVGSDQYEKLGSLLEKMFAEQNLYHYNYLGLVLASCNISRKKDRCYFCSEFVGELLVKHKIVSKEELPEVVTPMNFAELSFNQIYKGKLLDYKV